MLRKKEEPLQVSRPKYSWNHHLSTKIASILEPLYVSYLSASCHCSLPESQILDAPDIHKSMCPSVDMLHLWPCL